METTFCPACGQAASAGARLTWSSLVAATAASFNLERGYLSTALALTRRPAPTILSYLEGRRTALVSPVKYLLVLASLAFLVLRLLVPDVVGGPDDLERRIQEVGREWGNAVMVLSVPLFALGTWVLYARAGRTYPEHLALNAYVLGQQNLFSLLFLPLYYLGPSFAAWGMIVYLVLCWLYFAVALRGSVARTMPGAYVGSLILTLVVYLCYFGGIVALAFSNISA